MYYYVAELDRAATGRRFNERLADLLTDTGIAGEMVTQSALKTTDDLLKIGLQKGYSTVVAVGSDHHIHEVIRSLMSYPRDERPVLGVIPTDRDSLVAALVGAPNLNQALQTLKLRRLAHATLTEVADRRYLLTQAVIQPPRPIAIRARVDQAEIEAYARLIVITGDGRMEIQTAVPQDLKVKRALAWLIGGSVPIQDTSSFHGETMEVETEIPLPLVGHGQTLAHTPCTIRTMRRALKLIVTRATLSEASKDESEGVPNS